MITLISILCRFLFFLFDVETSGIYPSNVEIKFDSDFSMARTGQVTRIIRVEMHVNPL